MLEKRALWHLRKKRFPQQYPDLLPASLQIQRPQNQLQLPKQPPPSIKAPQLKPDDKKSVPTRKVPSSPRNNASRPASGKNIAASPSHKQPGSMVSAKLQPAKPTQSVKGKPDDKEPKTKPDDKEPATNLMIKNLQQNLRNFQQLQ